MENGFIFMQQAGLHSSNQDQGEGELVFAE
ncbi:hypothetical protein SAMN05216308_11358 [Nitrosospira sp. Nsp13]|nr:hypothetical protein SAMN05216308_11358 [Nitrosospira sp. Nsp13]